MKNLILVISILITSLQFVYGQKELIAKLKDDRIDFIESIDSLSDGSCMVTAHIAIPMTTGGWGLFYINDGDIQKIESGHTVNYLNKGKYIKSEGSVYRIRVETKKKQYQYFADKLVDLKFEEPKVPFYVADTFRHGIYKYSTETENVQLSFSDISTLHVVFTDAPSFSNAKLITDKLEPEEIENNMYGFLLKTNNELVFANILKEDENTGTILFRTIKKDGVLGVEYNLSFEFDIVSIMKAYFIDDELFITYMDKQGDLHFSNFLKVNGSFEPKSESELKLAEILTEYENKEPKSLLSTLLTSSYELFTYKNKGEDIHLLQMVQYNGKMDFFVIKVIDHRIVWTSSIPRGLHIPNGYNVVPKAMDNSFFKVKIENNLMIIDDVEIGPNYQENGEFLKSKRVYGFDRKVFNTQITINLEDGSHSRKIINEL